MLFLRGINEHVSETRQAESELRVLDLGMLLGWLLKRGQRASSTWRFVVLLPVALLAADLLENLLISLAVGAFPDRAAIGNALPLVTAAKFGAAIATIIAVVLVALMWLCDRLSGVLRGAT